MLIIYLVFHCLVSFVNSLSRLVDLQDFICVMVVTCGVCQVNLSICKTYLCYVMLVWFELLYACDVHVMV